MNFEDKQLKVFTKDAKELLGRNLAAIVLYGSRFWGYVGKGSDYDLFVLLNRPSKRFSNVKDKLSTKYKKIQIMYFYSLEEILEGIKKGGWASFLVLRFASKPVYSTKRYKLFLRKLKKVRPDLKKIVDNYNEKTNFYEIKELSKKRGFEANKWAALSIWKRLQLIKYAKAGRADVGFDASSKVFDSVLTKKDKIFIQELYKRLFSRSVSWSISDRVKSLSILRKLNKVLSELED